MQTIKHLSRCYLALLLLLAPLMPLRGQGADYNMLCSLQQQRTPALDGVFTWTSNSLVLAPAVPVSLLASGWMADNNDLIRSGAETGFAFLFACGVTEGLKLTVRRPRPFLAYPDDLQPVRTPRGFSFPSGHTSLSFAVATSVSLCYSKWYVVAPAMLWAAGVGFSRLYLGVHYPTDVLTGALVGAGSALLSHYLFRRLRDDSPVPTGKAFVVPVTIVF